MVSNVSQTRKESQSKRFVPMQGPKSILEKLMRPSRIKEDGKIKEIFHCPKCDSEVKVEQKDRTLTIAHHNREVIWAKCTTCGQSISKVIPKQ